MDYQRCADLHNEIMYRGWTESDRDWTQPQTWWQHQAPSSEIASQLSPSLIEFLKRAYLTPNDSRYPHCFFYYLGGLASAEDMISNGFLNIAKKNRYVLLYTTSPWNLDDKLGLAFDLHTSTATFIPNYNESVEICQHEWSWLPLEVILEGYMDMLKEGKVRIVPVTERQDRDYEGPTLVRPWQLYPYTALDVQKATSAMNRLVDAIEARIQVLASPAVATSYIHLPWHDPDAFPDELVPPSTFAHDFLKAISDIKIRFRYIAPGIRIPTLDEFFNQAYYGDDPLHIFLIETTNDTPLDPPEHGWSQYTIGVQITHANPYDDRHFTNEFRLELPFRVGAKGFAKQSTGQPLGIDPEDKPVPKGSRGELYQAGMSNGFTDYHGVQIHKVLESWAGMVEQGDWEVGPNGVLGGIEKFMEADTQEHWGKYTVPHSW